MNAVNYIHVHFPSRILGQHSKIVALDSKAMFVGTSRYSITRSLCLFFYPLPVPAQKARDCTQFPVTHVYTVHCTDASI
jgi:hypothetical protein